MMKNTKSCLMLHITLHEVIKLAFRQKRSKKPFCAETHFKTTAASFLNQFHFLSVLIVIALLLIFAILTL